MRGSGISEPSNWSRAIINSSRCAALLINALDIDIIRGIGINCGLICRGSDGCDVLKRIICIEIILLRAGAGYDRIPDEPTHHDWLIGGTSNIIRGLASVMIIDAALLEWKLFVFKNTTHRLIVLIDLAPLT